MKRLRAWHRVAWHRLTGRWPRYRWRRGWDGGRPCSRREREAFSRLAWSHRSKGLSAAEPDYERKRQP